MNRLMKKLELGRWMRQEMRGLLKLSPLVLASLVLMALLWGTDSAANSGLFQSSPVEPPPSATPTVAMTATTVPSPVPTLTPLASPEVTATATLTVTVSVTETVAPVETPTEMLPTETVPPAATLTPTELPATDTAVPTATIETPEPEPTSDESERYPEGESNLRFEWGMLFDSAALFFSYVWLCCGILVFLGVPVLFFVLWRASNRRQEGSPSEAGEQEEAQQEED